MELDRASLQVFRRLVPASSECEPVVDHMGSSSSEEEGALYLLSCGAHGIRPQDKGEWLSQQAIQ